MRPIQLNLNQAILNKANGKTEFTYFLNEDKKYYRYIVSCKGIYKGINPSLQTNLNILISDILKLNKYHSIGGWFDAKTGIYYLDANLHFKNIDTAKLLAIKNGQIAIYDSLKNESIYI